MINRATISVELITPGEETPAISMIPCNNDAVISVAMAEFAMLKTKRLMCLPRRQMMIPPASGYKNMRLIKADLIPCPKIAYTLSIRTHKRVRLI
jgi:hypothetical protein